VKEKYFPIAVGRFESRATEEPSFAAGQLATTAYRETKPRRLAGFYGRG
jgi:hypothetical protein